MAAKKVNPDLLQKLAKVDAKEKAPKPPSAADFRRKEEADKAKMKKGAPTPTPTTPTTTVPPTTTTIFDASKLTDKELDDLLFGTTTTTQPTTTTTTIAEKELKPQAPLGKPGEKINFMGMSVILNDKGGIDREKYPYAAAVRDDILVRASEARVNALYGEKPKKKGGGLLGTIGKVVGKGLEYTIAKPLMVIDAPRRVIISGIKEGVDAINAGDASWSDFWNQTKDPNFGFGDVVQTDIKWLDRAIGFVGDVALDPTTYLTLGTGTAAKMALKGVSKEFAEELIESSAKRIAKSVTTDAVGDIEREVAERIAKDLGEKTVPRSTISKKVLGGADEKVTQTLTKTEIKTLSRAIVSEGAQRAVRETGSQVAKDIRDVAIKNYTAVAPRRQLGAKTKEALAENLRLLKAEAKQAADDLAGTAAGRRAADFDNLITNDVIADVATRGYAALRGAIADELGIKSGYRLGFGSNKVYLGGGKVADYLGKKVAGSRLNLLTRGGRVGNVARGASDLLTGRGLGGAFGDADIFDMRTGLRQGILKGDEAVKAVQALAEDNAFRAVQKVSTNSTRAAFSPILRNKEYKPFYNTVHQVLARPEVVVGDLASDIADNLTRSGVIKDALGNARVVTEAEVKFAQELKDAVADLADDVSNLLDDLGISRPVNVEFVPQVLDNRSIAWLSSKNVGKGPGTSPAEVLRQLKLGRKPMAGEFIGHGLKAGDEFFGQEVTQEILDEGINGLNRLARQGGFKGNFFEVNIASALNRYASKFGSDYAFLRRLVDNNYGDIGRVGMPGRETGGAKGAIGTREAVDNFRGPLTSDDFIALRDAALDTWTIDDIDTLVDSINDNITLLSQKNIPSTVKQINREAQDEVIKLLEQLKVGMESGAYLPDYVAGLADPAYASSMMGIFDDYSSLIAKWSEFLSKDRDFIIKAANNISPVHLRTVRNINDDAFVALINDLAPDVYARADIATLYDNVRRATDPKNIGPVKAFIKDYTNFFKTWVTTTPGFHVRNMISNAWQMLAAGGSPELLLEGRKVYKEWNDYLKTVSSLTAGERAFADLGAGGLRPESLVFDFINKANLSPRQEQAFVETILQSGAVTEGDLLDVFRGVTPGAARTGFTGKEIRTDISRVRQKVSQVAGYLPARSRAFGDDIEKANRFMLTYDGIRQGYSPQEAAARTQRFLVDYEDLSKLDEKAKQIIPFWMWMSRNLPVQLQNMYANPALYQGYNTLKRNIEDEDGENPLIPDWLKKSGAFKLPIPGIREDEELGFNIYARPDFGFPGTGSPSPLVEGVSDPGALLAATNPAIRALIEYGTGRDIQYGNDITTGDGGLFTDPGRYSAFAEEASAFPSWLGRVYSAFGGAQTDLPGPESVQDIFRVAPPTINYKGKTYKKGSPQYQAWLNSLLSFTGVPARIVGPNEEASALRDYLKMLEEYLGIR